ncbi:MAG: murein biosynthesis integral membrane protein MurJ [Chloroflexota bacterium]
MSKVFRASLILAVFFAADKALGLIRQVLIARQFGLTYNIDVFNAANNIPDLLSALISGGALGVAFIPVLSEYMEKKGHAQAWELFARIVNFAFLVTGALAVVVVIFADPIVRYVIAPGFPEPQKLLAIQLMRLDLIAIVIFSISGLVMAGLQANQHFLLPAMAPLFYNLGQIFGIMLLAPAVGGRTFGPLTLPTFGFGIHGLVYGVIIGAFLHLLIQVPGLIMFKFKWKPVIGLNDPGVRQVLALLGPRVLTMLFIQSYFVARDNLASRMGEGSVSALNYGWFIMQVPETLIGTAIAIVLLPTLSEFVARGDMESFKNTLNKGIRVLVALTIPVTVIVAVGLPQVVQVLGFDAAGTARVVLATRAYLLGLLGHSLLEIASRSFYARQDARTPLLAAAVMLVLFMICAIGYSSLWGFVGIALANVTAFTFEALLLLYLLNRKIPGVVNVWDSIPRVLAAALVGGVVVFGLQHWLPLPEMRRLIESVVGAATMGVAALVMLPLIWREVKLLIKL